MGYTQSWFSSHDRLQCYTSFETAKGQVPQAKKCVTFELERRFAKKKGSYEVPNHKNENNKVNVWTQ